GLQRLEGPTTMASTPSGAVPLGSSHGNFPVSPRAIFRAGSAAARVIIASQFLPSLPIQLLLDRACDLVDGLRTGHRLLHTGHDRRGAGREGRTEWRRGQGGDDRGGGAFV